jgi:hypothetical protein
MNIWTGLLFLDGSLPDVDLARELAADDTPSKGGPGAPPAPSTEPSDRDREAQAARAAIPLWRASPGIALR